MAYSVLLQNDVAATNVDSWNRTGKAGAQLENGNLVYPSAISATAGEKEVWTLTQPVTATLGKLWMVATPEQVLTDSKYKNIDPDVRDFVIASGSICDIYKPQVGDIITLTADAMDNAISTNTFISAQDAAYDFEWTASATSGALSYRLIETTYLSFGRGGTLGSTGRVTAYRFECVQTG